MMTILIRNAAVINLNSISEELKLKGIVLADFEIDPEEYKYMAIASILNHVTKISKDKRFGVYVEYNETSIFFDAINDETTIEILSNNICSGIDDNDTNTLLTYRAVLDAIDVYEMYKDEGLNEYPSFDLHAMGNNCQEAAQKLMRIRKAVNLVLTEEPEMLFVNERYEQGYKVMNKAVTRGYIDCNCILPNHIKKLNKYVTFF